LGGGLGGELVGGGTAGGGQGGGVVRSAALGLSADEHDGAQRIEQVRELLLLIWSDVQVQMGFPSKRAWQSRLTARREEEEAGLVAA